MWNLGSSRRRRPIDSRANRRYSGKSDRPAVIPRKIRIRGEIRPHFSTLGHVVACAESAERPGKYRAVRGPVARPVLRRDGVLAISTRSVVIPRNRQSPGGGRAEFRAPWIRGRFCRGIRESWEISVARGPAARPVLRRWAGFRNSLPRYGGIPLSRASTRRMADPRAAEIPRYFA